MRRRERRGPRRALAASGAPWRWLLLLLGLALAAGMGWTLWAGRAGKIRSLHGAVGDGGLERATANHRSVEPPKSLLDARA